MHVLSKNYNNQYLPKRFKQQRINQFHHYNSPNNHRRTRWGMGAAWASCDYHAATFRATALDFRAETFLFAYQLDM